MKQQRSCWSLHWQSLQTKKTMCCCIQLCVERIVGAHGMINYVDARTAWMDDIVKQAQWQGITQVG